MERTHRQPFVATPSTPERRSVVDMTPQQIVQHVRELELKTSPNTREARAQLRAIFAVAGIPAGLGVLRLVQTLGPQIAELFR